MSERFEQQVAFLKALPYETPPDETTFTSDRSWPCTANEETWLLPALTTKSQRPLALTATEPCDPRPVPVPDPPVAILPAEASEPSGARSKIRTSLAALFVCV